MGAFDFHTVVHLHDAMHDRNIAVLNLEDDDLAHLRTDQPVSQVLG